MRQFITIFVLAILVASCETEVYYSGDNYKPYVVVESIISSDSTWSVSLFWSQYAYDYSEPLPVEDAIIDIEVISDEEGDLETLQKFSLDNNGQGKYSYGSKPAPGRYYQMTISAGDHIVTAQTYVPIVFYPVYIIRESVLDEQTNERTISIELEINEDSTHDNFYAYTLEKVNIEQPTNSPIDSPTEAPGYKEGDENDSNESGEGTGKLKNGTKTGNNEPRLLKNNITKGVTLVEGSNEGFIFKETFSGEDLDNNGETITTSSTTTTTFLKSNNYKLSIWAISYDYYQYLVTSKQNQSATSEHPYTNPYSNINNGGGIFAGYNLQELTIPID